MRILIVDDEKAFAQSLRALLIKRKYSITVVYSAEKALEALSGENFDVLLTDMKMEGMDGLSLVRYVAQEYPQIESIVITAYASIENAVEAMKSGAFSYYIKSSDPRELLFDLEKLQTMHELKSANQLLKEGTNSQEYMLDTKNEKFRQLLHFARKVAPTDANVLLLGESGVGKEVIARYIHNHSTRHREVFLPLNCYSFSDTMLEAELYGHEHGSFTGASSSRIGRFEASDKGTLFLDEIGDIPLSTQSKILRNIERKEIERIGSNETIALDFRLISATNSLMDEAIATGKFRQDLYYRISTVLLHIPPLRERKEDLPLLIRYFSKRISTEMKKPVLEIGDELMGALLQYNYPGNLRELKNIIERLVVLSENGRVQMKQLRSFSMFGSIAFDQKNFHEPLLSLRDVRRNAEKKHIESILQDCDSNMEEAAQILQLSIRQLYNKVKEYNIK